MWEWGGKRKPPKAGSAKKPGCLSKLLGSATAILAVVLTALVVVEHWSAL